MRTATVVRLGTNPVVLGSRGKGLSAIAQAVQSGSRGEIGFTLEGVRVGDLRGEKLSTAGARCGVDLEEASSFIAQAVEYPLLAGRYPLEILLNLKKNGLTVQETLDSLHATQLPFVAGKVVPAIESRQLRVFLLGPGGYGVVSAAQDLAVAFCATGYRVRAFPVFDPSKKGSPLTGYLVASREALFSHAPFESPNIILLLDEKLFPLLRWHLGEFAIADPEKTILLVNTPRDPVSFRAAANFHDPYAFFTVDADALVRGKRIPPNYGVVGGMLGILGKKAVDVDAFTTVVKTSLEEKFGPGDTVQANLDALARAQEKVVGEAGNLRGGEASSHVRNALGLVTAPVAPKGQELRCNHGNDAIALAMYSVLNMFPSVVAAYPITPQTEIVMGLAQMIADGKLFTAEMVLGESEHGAACALAGAARDQVLAYTATSSQGFALMIEVIYSIFGMRMGNVLISLVMRSLNSPLDVQNDHSDLMKLGLDAGGLVYMTRDVQEAFDFHLFAYLVSLYAEYRKTREGLLEMIPDRAVMLPSIVASEGFEVSHAPEGYYALTPPLVKALYDDPSFRYVSTFVRPGKLIGTNNNIMGALQLSDGRLETDHQRHRAIMDLSYEVLKKVFDKYEEYTGRRYDFLSTCNVEQAEAVFVVAGPANRTFEEVALEFKRQGIQVGVVHPNVLRPCPRLEWATVLKDKQVIVYDRDDPFGAPGGRIYLDLTAVKNEYQLDGTNLIPRIYGLGGRTPTLSLVRDEMVKALRHVRGEIALSPQKEYVGVRV